VGWIQIAFVDAQVHRHLLVTGNGRYPSSPSAYSYAPEPNNDTAPSPLEDWPTTFLCRSRYGPAEEIVYYNIVSPEGIAADVQPVIMQFINGNWLRGFSAELPLHGAVGRLFSAGHRTPQGEAIGAHACSSKSTHPTAKYAEDGCCFQWFNASFTAC